MPKTAKKSLKVSVVVPIYNVEKYLRECVDSILSQTLKEMEVILIDDGSPDGCGKIIDEYAKRDNRVVVVHQKNSGYSAAVNRGIELARGEYIGIIESDDFIEPDMYETLYKNAKKYNTDITKGEFYIYNSTLPEGARDKLFVNPGRVDLRNAPNGPFAAHEWPAIIAFHSSIWSSIYRADYLKNKKIPETAGASYQDLPFMLDAICNASKITVVKKPFVHWRNDPNQGNSTSARGEKLLLMAKNTQTGLRIIQKTGHYDELKEAFYTQAFWANINFFHKIRRNLRKRYYVEFQKIFKNINIGELKYIYLRNEDKKCVESLIKNEGCYRLYMLFAMGGVKRKITSILGRK
ncbi:glycosyltransferase [Candidatus Saccharibacteria bacterium]|nr:glycosyltransferase [Candidatus Saccharibacteria bacterium]